MSFAGSKGALQELVVGRQGRDDLGVEEGVQVLSAEPAFDEAHRVRQPSLSHELVGEAVAREGVRPALR